MTSLSIRGRNPGWKRAELAVRMYAHHPINKGSILQEPHVLERTKCRVQRLQGIDELGCHNESVCLPANRHAGGLSVSRGYGCGDLRVKLFQEKEFVGADEQVGRCESRVPIIRS